MTDTSVRVTSEPLTYDRHAPTSFFRDLIAAGRGEQAATQRLERHAAETRANPSTTAGIGGEFAPPAWLIPLFSPSAAGGRVVADLIDRVGNRFDLPAGVSSINVPRMIVGALVQAQTGQGGVVPAQDITTGNAQGQGQVVTIAGQADVANQILDLTPAPGLDQVIAKELTSLYNQNLDLQCLQGSGVNGQLKGLKTVATGSHVIDGSAATTIPTVWVAIGKACAAVGNDRLQPAKQILMAPRRWEWIASSVDSSNRPISSPGADGPRQPAWPPVGGVDEQAENAVGPIMGKPTWLCGAIPAGTTADYILTFRPNDCYLWESSPKFAVVSNPLSATLQSRIQLRRYVALVADRYPSSVAVVNALPQPSGF